MNVRHSLVVTALAVVASAVPAAAFAQSAPSTTAPAGAPVTTKVNKGVKPQGTKADHLAAKCQAYQAREAEADAKLSAAQGAVTQLQTERAAAVAANRTKVVAKIDQRLPKAQAAVTKAQELVAKIEATDHCSTPPQKANGPKSGGATPTTVPASTVPVTTAPVTTVAAPAPTTVPAA